MRLRAQSYHNLDGTLATQVSIPWYWRLLATASSVLILGGFLMLPITFDTDPQLRVSKVGLGIFALVVLILGVVATVLSCFVVRDSAFRASSVLQPALIACILGFLTIFYNIIISKRYHWNVLATLTTVVSGAGAITYSGLLFWTYRKIKTTGAMPVPGIQITQEGPSPGLEEAADWRQTPEYYQNYIKNMFPSAATSEDSSSLPPEPASVITEEEMQRQQMLMLLLRQDQAPRANSSSNTFHIEWQGHDQDIGYTPINGNVMRRVTGPSSASVYSQSNRTPSTASARLTGAPPWDGVWRNIDIAQQPSTLVRASSREDRRRQIEMGL